MTSFRQFLLESNEYLYHATYEPHIAKIMAEGLHGNSGNKNWEDSKPNVVYLSEHPEVAESYAEASENVPEHYLDQIKVLRILKKNLNPKLLHQDSNVIDGDSTFEYHGNIHPNHLEVIK